MSETIPKSVTIIGRRWFDRIYGNTYFSAAILVNGETVHTIDFEYGHDGQYEQSAMDWLDASGLVAPRKQYANGGHEATWQWAEREGITFESHVSDVSRKKDL